MTTTGRIGAALGATAALAAATLTSPALAAADPPTEPCMLGWSNTGVRSCVTASAGMAPVPTLGDGVCAGIVRAERITSFDGPLWEYSSAEGMSHGIELNLTQGYSPLGEWSSTALACSQEVIVDWHNLETGAAGTETMFIPADRPSYVENLMHIASGPGPVALALRTNHPSLPATTVIDVP